MMVITKYTVESAQSPDETMTIPAGKSELILPCSVSIKPNRGKVEWVKLLNEDNMSFITEWKFNLANERKNGTLLATEPTIEDPYTANTEYSKISDNDFRLMIVHVTKANEGRYR